jgi:hypothetical protein
MMPAHPTRRSDMLRRITSKRITILGRSVPLAAVLLAVAAVGAAAAFLLFGTANVSITAQPGPNVTFTGWTCEISDGPGSVTDCTGNGDQSAVTVAVDGADDTTVLRVIHQVNAVSPATVQVIAPSPLPAGVSAITQPAGTDGFGGATISGGSAIWSRTELGNLTPSQVVDPFEISFEYSDAP